MPHIPRKDRTPSVSDHEPKMEKWLDDLEEVRRVTSRTLEPNLRPASKGRVYKGKLRGLVGARR